MDATCAWCSEPIPPAAVDAHVVRGADHELPACSPSCLAELVAMITGARAPRRN